MADLSEFTTIGVGGPATKLITPTNRAELIDTTKQVWGSGDDWLLLGGGSNMVIADEGFPGTVIRIESRGIDIALDHDGRHARVRAEAGESWDSLVAACVMEGLSGIETLSGIPGTSGAAVVQNIGAYGQELSQRLVGVHFLDAITEQLRWIDLHELDLGYRTSALKHSLTGVVLAIELDLDVDRYAKPLSYPALADALDAPLGDRLPLAQVRDAVCQLRRKRGMLLDSADPDSRSVGSFFTNPVVRESFARTLPADAPRWPTQASEPDRLLAIGQSVPALVASEYWVKLSAAWLIEKSGIGRGFSLPSSRAAISDKHTLALVNRGGASAAEVIQLARFVQTRVLAEFGVLLQAEPSLIGLSL